MLVHPGGRPYGWSSMPLTRAAVVGALTLLVSSACVHRLADPLWALEGASRAVAAGSTEASALALAGFRALLVDGDAALAGARFDEALARDEAEPWALYGKGLLAAQRAHPELVLDHTLELLERVRRHPLKVVAARQVLELTGQAKSFDEAVRARVPAILEGELPADAAHLLRAALVNAHRDLDQLAQASAVLADMGVPTVATLVGPFSPWHQLSMAEETPVERSGSLTDLGAGPYGPLTPRTLRFADGRFALSGEPSAGDVYVLAVDVTVEGTATWVLRTVTSMDHVAVMDGTRVLSRLTWQRPLPTLTTQALTLAPGRHRLVVRMARENQAGHLMIALHRLDGRPARLAFAPASGPAPRWSGGVDLVEAPGLFASPGELARQLTPSVGAALAGFVAARDGLGRDPDGASALVATLAEHLDSPSVSALEADAALADRAVPSRVGRGRAARELEAALAKDRHLIAAQLTLARLALDDNRPLDALEAVKASRARDASPGAPLHALQAHVELSLGLDAAAAVSAAKASEAVPGFCDGLLLEYDVARRRDAVAEADQLLAQTSHCSGYLPRAAEHLRARGRLEDAQRQYAALLEQDESQASAAISLSGLLAARRRFDEAVAVLHRQRAVWPRNPQLLKALGDVEEQAGRAKEALAAREAALAIDGADLRLRRQVERAKTGQELLQQEAVSTEDAIASYESAPGSEDATSAFVLDFAAIQAFPDGSMVDRIHIIQKALDQQGVQEVAEVQIPEDAVVLTLRTLKPDGRRLEPEHIEGKDDVSLPGVQVGDMVEYEFLLAHPSRGPGQPGFTASNFYFQIARQPNARSTYVVKAPLGSGLKVDAHNVVAPAPVVEGDQEVFRHEERKVPPYIPEPGGPPSGNEWLPFVSVGAGQEGHLGVLNAYADAFFDRGLVTDEVRRFATSAAKGASGLEALKAVYAAVMDKLSGRDAGLAVSAGASVAQDRGSRTWLLYASLRALGIDARLAAVRTFTADPAPYLFPAEGLFNYVCIVVRQPDGALVWLDPLIRYAPFGELPELATGRREAWLLPEPGRPTERVETPPATRAVTKDVRLTMRLSEQGRLSGDGVETYSGFEAAQLAEALESLSAEQREQALQSALSRYFGGADLSDLEVDAQRRVGGTVTVSYHFEASHFARVDAPGRLVAGALTFPHQLGRRYLTTATRVTPLFIDASETSHVEATVTVPAGWRLVDPLGSIERDGPSARYARTEHQEGDVLRVSEDFHLAQSRIPPKLYESFGQFAGELDLLQQREITFEKAPGPALSTRL